MNAKRRQDCRYVWPTCEASAYARYDLSRCRTHHRGFSLRALPETPVSDSYERNSRFKPMEIPERKGRAVLPQNKHYNPLQLFLLFFN
jgi:hypothetical protein